MWPGETRTIRTIHSISGDHSKYDQILIVKIYKYTGFCVCRRFYLIWYPVIYIQILHSLSQR